MLANSTTQRDQLRKRLAAQTEAFESAGGVVLRVGFQMRDMNLPKGQYGRSHYHAPEAGHPDALADTHLVEKLRAHAVLGDSVVKAAGQLNVSPAHCRRLATANGIEFRR